MRMGHPMANQSYRDRYLLARLNRMFNRQTDKNGTRLWVNEGYRPKSAAALFRRIEKSQSRPQNPNK